MTGAHLSMEREMFRDLLTELAWRGQGGPGQGGRESGAFLLADRGGSAQLPQRVTSVAFYDDLDPDCLTGRIDFGATGYSALNALCRRQDLRVVADIHTHPYASTRQSTIDAANPMVAMDGHLALIAPHLAVGVTDTAQLGVHLRQGGRWTSYYGPQATAMIDVPPPSVPASWWHRLRRLLRRPAGRRSR